ncbi:MAG: hypothetical protein R3A79_16145 [Nannocystaceae bacterium]
MRTTTESPAILDPRRPRLRLVAALALGLSLACQGGPAESTSATASESGATTEGSTSSTTEGASTSTSTTGETSTTTEGSATSGSATSEGSTTTDGGTTAGTETDGGDCEILEGAEIEAEYVGFCPMDESVVISDAATWAKFVEDCVFNGPDPAPEVDFAVTDIVGRGETIACPFAEGYQLLGAKRCGATLEIHAWAHSDHCYCDYFVNALHLFAVPKGTVDAIVWVDVPEVTCDEVLCMCPEETPGCEAGACSTVPDPDVDGLPPAWP